MSAVFSYCGTWRYRLDRDFLLPGPTIAFCLHNPSTAGADNEDPTSRRGIGFARLWGAGKLVYVNPWAGCATNPKDLWSMPDPIGPMNDFHISAVAKAVYETGGFFVFAWGAVSPPKHLKYSVTRRLKDVEKIVRDHGCEVRSLGVTKDGAPRHPLYLRADTVPAPWPALQQEPRP
ncbi:DUF1643 domain-containing protein [Mesorhizobium sp. M0955]|uniref:DUF1643 domain-containing protein n=1 Tax=Mesorhizobium sp. M0955 TaxID=2957033 RepID=UPI003334DB00